VRLPGIFVFEKWMKNGGFRLEQGFFPAEDML